MVPRDGRHIAGYSKAMICDPGGVRGLIGHRWKHNHRSSEEDSFLDRTQTSVRYQHIGSFDNLQLRHTRHDDHVFRNTSEIVSKMFAGDDYQLAIREICSGVDNDLQKPLRSNQVLWLATHRAVEQPLAGIKFLPVERVVLIPL